MDVNISYVSLVRRLGKPPVFAHDLRQVLQTRNFLPTIATVFTAEQSHRLDAAIHDLTVGRIDRDGADVAVEYFRPALAGICGTVQTIVGDTDINLFRKILAAVDRVNDAVFEVSRDFLPAAVG